MATPDYSFLITSIGFIPRRRLARKVVDEAMKRVSSPKTFSVAKVFIVSEEYVIALKECGMEKQNVIFVGVIGMGGIGKFTLAKTLFDDTRSNLSRASYIEDVKCQVEKNGLKHISQIFFRQLQHYDFELSNSNRDVLYQLSELNFWQSEERFCTHAIHSDRFFTPFESLVDQFVNVCKGLPLALEIYGGRAIVDEESRKYPGRRSRVWRYSHVKEILRNFTGTECVRGRSLVSGETVLWNEDEFGNICAWIADLFANTNELQLLELNYDSLKGDFGKLSPKPLLLRWRNFLYDRKVDFPQCRILKTIPGEFCYLKALDVLNLNFCRRLKYLPPGIGDLSRLETLRLDDSPTLKEIPTTVGNISRLNILCLTDCPRLKEILNATCWPIKVFRQMGCLFTVCRHVSLHRFELLTSSWQMVPANNQSKLSWSLAF
eukprot:Gb_04466 [translate_table: standard]